MWRRALPLVLFIAYCAVLVDVMVFKNIPTIHVGHLILRFGGGAPGPANFIPFETIIPYLRGEKGGLIDMVEIFGNIIPLIPLGIIAVFLFRHISWKGALALSLATGIIIESMQVIFRVGVFDIDDVILNGLGVMIGCGISAAIMRLMRSGQ